MEETVRSLLQNQDSLDGPKVDPLDLMKAYKAENSALSMENDNQRKQYERCLDEVANQVVQALLTQKDLKEECVKLRTRVFDLEQQNRILSVLFQQRVKMSTIPVSQEVQRNGKAGIPAGRWPSLLSLTCPRSSGSGSGSELSLSSACSEYSSGSHTWAEGRGFSKQCAASRDKRMSTGSVSSNHSAPIEHTELGWKEGHILKGLKRLQMCSSKEASSHASVPHCKDCMTSNEGIYSLGVKCGLQGAIAKQVSPTSKPLKAEEGIAALDSDDADDDSPKLQSRESSNQPTKELLCLEKLDVTRDDDGNFLQDPVKLAGNSGLFPSPVTDNFLFLEGPMCGGHEKVRRKIETRCNSLDSEPSVQPVASDSGVMLDWGFDEEGWLFKRSVSVSTRPLLKPVMGMNGAKARSQSFGARYMDRPSFNRSGKVRTQIKTHSGSSLNSLGDVLPGSMSCSSSYHCPMNRSLLNNFLIEEGLTVPSHLGSSSERLQSLKLQREQARRLQIEQQFSSAFGEPVSEEPERQSTITTIEEKVMLGIEENLHKSHEQERGNDVKQKSGSTLANWFGFRKSKLPAPSGKKTDPPKVKEDKKEQKITSLLGGKQTKSDKKRDRRKSDGKDCSVGRRESHDAVRACISMPCPGMSLNEIQGHPDITGDPKMQMMSRRADGENGSTVKSPNQDAVIGSGCKMRTLDSGIGTIPLPESCSFFSSILHLLPKSSSTPEQSLSPLSVPGSSSEDVSPSPLPRWRIPSSFKDSSHAGVPNSLSDSSMTHIQSVPFPTVAFLQPIQPQSEPIVTSASVCDTQSRLPRAPQGGMEPKKLTYIKSKTRATASQQKEQTRLQLANCKT
ncbi:nck-associated protein 5 isoform X1 [Lates japonicus]|uniref:Nck-associated protein 5 isoform X1 n=1 Tax=Lates japonicus TaxID=270547 RepID=A0AAD3MD00_LATJO|nr:nck-associated protein 5 isoform X1 [Lates japonicus]